MASHATTPCALKASPSPLGGSGLGRSAGGKANPRKNVFAPPLGSGPGNRPPLGLKWSNKQSAFWKAKAKVNEVTAEKSANSALVDGKSEASVSDGGNGSATSSPITDPAVISGFMAKVSDLVKLVDSKDISELQLKQLDFEITIRKKEAIQQPIVTAPIPQTVFPSYAPPPPPIPAPVPTPSGQGPPKAPALPAPAKPSCSSHPSLKCPMAGTFYRSPAPGEPPFVKVGDKVQKGQVVCIIEAMKLMNEIEADQSGTISGILVEDGKPVSVDTPLFTIAP
ncbi:hypothetical protein MLD38_013168 [Melastoma candidum]|uniref:Uncharacterized protein n=1 Tax=Melastoma candidum TaxID=119954 RepID=A0ACB9R8P6_9MYRT|nr:hypothetical protein MLD38_013168 [Melastoma candidum]